MKVYKVYIEGVCGGLIHYLVVADSFAKAEQLLKETIGHRPIHSIEVIESELLAIQKNDSALNEE